MKSQIIPRKIKHHLDGPVQMRAEHIAQDLPDKHAFPSKRGKNLPGGQPGAQVEMIQEKDHGSKGVNRNTRKPKSK